jgi:cytochrome bd-type quinol oxidase subunit 2
VPRLSCWLIKASLLHLAIGALLGGLILSAKGHSAVLGWAWQLLPAHIQLVVGGWLIQLTLGMAYWILPRLDSSGTRGRPVLAWTSFGTLNVGVIGTTVCLALRPFLTAPWFDVLFVLVAPLQVMALGAFAHHAWPRIRRLPMPTVERRLVDQSTQKQ